MLDMVNRNYCNYKWQIRICKQNLDNANDREISELAHLIRNQFIHTKSRHEWGFLEHQLCQIQSFDQILKLTHQSIGELKKFCKERNLILWPSSIWRERRNFGSLAIGLAITDNPNPKEIFKLWNRIIPYLPGFIALMVNSPAQRLMAKEYKSYRMKDSWELMPAMPNDENGYQEWGFQDLAIEVPYLTSTIADSPSSPQLVCEYIALFWSLAYALLTGQTDQNKQSKGSYEEYLINRKLAATYGLQAIFTYDRRKRESVDLIWEVMEIAKPGLKKLGAEIDDLKTIKQMLQKRQTQADMALTIINRYNYNADIHSFYMAYGNIISNFNAFEEYLASAPELRPIESPSVEDLIASKIHFNSRYWLVQMASGLPPVYFNSFIKNVKRKCRQCRQCRQFFCGDKDAKAFS